MSTKNIDPLKHKTYFSYLKAKTKTQGLYKNVKNIYTFFQKYILVGRIIRFIRLFILWLEAGAYFLLVVSFSVVVLPLLLIIIVSFHLHSAFIHRKMNKSFLKMIDRFNFVVIFIASPDKADKQCDNSNICIYVLTNPYAKLTASSKRITENVFMINTNYFYSLKKHVLDKNKSKVIYVNLEDN